MARTHDGDRAYSWWKAKQLARKQGYGEKIEVPKTDEPSLPPEFERSALSISAGAQAVYRDQQKTDSFQVREYEGKWTIELDQHNPEAGNPLAHAVYDAPKYTAAAVVAVGAITSGLSS
ncbi:hypothetical protein HZS55_22055 [Halosimplex rubrum]|uniref:Uncharacterized protein n=1 Tax=Halosimplex rubrum TaxID=869889 RepID=A0A7D5TPK4_9EURY|nr:hypothetical protein [Halosimplex rubrum]QLH79812.1 hypothetical protein HZS55_22055 [Halosimplex rubrum]